VVKKNASFLSVCGKNLLPFWRTLIFPIDGFSAKTRQIGGLVPFYKDAAPTEL